LVIEVASKERLRGVERSNGLGGDAVVVDVLAIDLEEVVLNTHHHDDVRYDHDHDHDDYARYDEATMLDCRSCVVAENHDTMTIVCECECVYDR